MNEFCQDRDLLALEPALFIGGGLASQQLAAGSASIAGTALACEDADFISAAVCQGMVVCVYADSPFEGRAYEIVSVDSATQLTISVLRAEVSLAPIAPGMADGSFHVRTYRPQIQAVSAALAEKLRRAAELTGVSVSDFADSWQLRLTSAQGVLAALYAMRAENAGSDDPDWTKAQHYRQEFLSSQLQLRLVSDRDGDGLADQTRTLGNVRLRRV